MKYRILLVLLLSIAGLVGCAKTPKLAQLPPEASILAFGDSLTFGTGAQPAESYPAVLAVLTGHPVVNAGIPGQTSAEGRERLAQTLNDTHPALLILCMGGNDFLQKFPEKQTVANLRAMIELTQSQQVPILLIATPRPGLGISIPDFYASLAKQYAIPLEAKALEDILSKRALKSDLVHPNATGYRQLAEAIDLVLKKAGAL
ncbi:MAG: GDSL-type esterase/lipase family protein [Formivibrio sp.]|nr:GDSL-type esterase/lipase family protein [Formivibrio sp.]